MRDWQSQAHVKHYCRYHVVFVPKYRKKALYGTLRREIHVTPGDQEDPERAVSAA